MRSALALRILIAGLVMAGASVAPASAQTGGGFFPWLFQSEPQPQPQPQVQPPPQQRVRIAPRPQVRPNPTPLAPVVRRAAPRPRIVQEPRVQEARPAPREAPAVRSAAVVAPAKPKVEPTSFVHVMGDSLAELLGDGLEEVLTDRPEVAVTRRIRSESGLVRSDVHDWPKTVTEMLAKGDKVTFAVMMLGMNDRQPLRDEAGAVHDAGSPRWREMYGARVEAVARAFAERRVPLLWAGLPPMQGSRFFADMLALNEVIRASVQKSGGTYVDIWEGFVDAQERFSAFGPDVSGQITRLRTVDGVHFTRAGARKVAHFVDVELKRLMGGTRPPVLAPTAEVASLPIDVMPGSVERAIDRMVAPLPEPEGIVPTAPAKPSVGPVVPLTGVAAATGGRLLDRRDEAQATDESGLLVRRVFSEGRPLEARPGRADDFRWTGQ